MNSPRILITGGTGLLGKTLLETAPGGWQIWGTCHRNQPPQEWEDRFFRLDMLDGKSIADLIGSLHPDVVIHTACVGSVDFAEQNPELVRKINVEGLKQVARACHSRGSFLVLISSNAVFDGNSPPYSEESRTTSVNRYGQIKIEAENWLRSSDLRHLIVRPILLYGWPLPGGRQNAVTRWLAQLEKNETIEAATDITTMPLFASNCTETIWNGIQRKRDGIVHVAGADRLTLYDFARETARLFCYNERLILPVRSSQMAGFAPRPKDTSFVTQRMQLEFGIRPMGVTEGLTQMLQSRITSPS